ncbi:hypothetical protein ScPMuIL_004664 [Solemya velum]
MADLAGSGDDKPPEYVIIEEIYEHVDAQEDFELALERALDAEAKVVVIEPVKLGQETSFWIKSGNCLHKTSVISGVCSLAVGTALPNKEAIILPLGFLSVLCAGVYAVSWQFDPCCKYQVIMTLPC